MSPLPVLVSLLSLVSLSQARVVTRCELRDELLRQVTLPRNLRQNPERAMARVICEIEKFSHLDTNFVREYSQEIITQVDTTSPPVTDDTFPTIAESPPYPIDPSPNPTDLMPTNDYFFFSPFSEETTIPYTDTTEPPPPPPTTPRPPTTTPEATTTTIEPTPHPEDGVFTPYPETTSISPTTTTPTPPTTTPGLPPTTSVPTPFPESPEPPSTTVPPPEPPTSTIPPPTTTPRPPTTTPGPPPTTSVPTPYPESPEPPSTTVPPPPTTTPAPPTTPAPTTTTTTTEAPPPPPTTAAAPRARRALRKKRSSVVSQSVKYFGLFQFSDRVHCQSGYAESEDVCKSDCYKFADDDISDDVECFVQSNRFMELYRSASGSCRRRQTLDSFFKACDAGEKPTSKRRKFGVVISGGSYK
ncbi:hypothetical protein WMY93_007015 [Mugilogobius chulae]|uniref:Glycosyl hydrolases family 22 (GH22) domain-containing protein n=1 Tax=Mugilogobius chulae TaxID=88201 RepID=A0AAW0PLQ4_9GOBI